MLSRAKFYILTLVVLCACMCGARAEISKEKRQEIDRTLRLVGMKKLMDQMKTQMLSGLKEQMPQVPKDFWQKFEQKMDMNELLEKIMPLYDKYYTLEDLKAVNAFYESPVGQKVLSTLPQIMQESMEVGRQWGLKIGAQAAEEAQQEMQKKSNASQDQRL